MRTIIVFLFSAALGIAAGLFCSTFYSVVTVNDDGMTPALIKGDHVLLEFYMSTGKKPERGDVVEVENALYAETGENSRMLKRIVGMPGETVSISDGYVWIDGTPLVGEDFDEIRIGTETMTERKIPEDAYFVLGDNLPDSTDSRDVTVGMVREKDILGKVILEW